MASRDRAIHTRAKKFAFGILNNIISPYYRLLAEWFISLSFRKKKERKFRSDIRTQIYEYKIQIWDRNTRFECWRNDRYEGNYEV